jgi:hypothetical protein
MRVEASIRKAFIVVTTTMYSPPRSLSSARKRRFDTLVRQEARYAEGESKDAAWQAVDEPRPLRMAPRLIMDHRNGAFMRSLG